MKFLELKNKNGKLRISKIVLGTDYFGTTVPEEKAFRLLDNFMDAGGNCIDTARIYASWLPGGDGVSEGTIGKWMKSRHCRNKVILSTKGGHPPLDDMKSGRLSRKDIEYDLDKSLRTLGIDEIDMYWLHRDEPSHPVEDIMETLSILIKKGKVRAVGCSNWKPERIETANRTARAADASAFSASQIQWSLAASTPEVHGDPTIVCMDDNQYSWYEKECFPVFAYSSQAKGFFARASALGLDAINKKAYMRFYTPDNISRLERVKEYTAKNGLTPTAAALGYILCNRVPAVAIIGCKNEEQLADSLTAADVELPGEVSDWLYRGKNSNHEPSPL
jgi:aryl-alcohol dehydrogenase-like predicted oxidoreductase